jgi:hypothetical protein
MRVSPKAAIQHDDASQTPDFRAYGYAGNGIAGESRGQQTKTDRRKAFTSNNQTGDHGKIRSMPDPRLALTAHRSPH